MMNHNDIYNKLRLKILVVGAWRYGIYEEALANGFKMLGHHVMALSWSKRASFLNSFFVRVNEKILLKVYLKNINRVLVNLCKADNPDLVFIYKGTHILPKTIYKIKKLGIEVFGYNNDDPFSKLANSLRWRHFNSSIPFYSHIFAYRNKNISDYINHNVKSTSLLRSYYIKKNNFPIYDINKIYDVTFIGHYENDRRDEYIKFLFENKIKIKLFGTGWKHSKYYKYLLRMNGPVLSLRGNSYNDALNKSKISLVFLSKINNDTYTRRCFEIPATKTFMLSEFTKDINSMYKEGLEIEFFKNKKELLSKIIYYLANPKEREKIAKNGYLRLLKDKHESRDRCQEVINIYKKLKKYEDNKNEEKEQHFNNRSSW